MSIEAKKEALEALEAMKSDRCAEEKIHINSAIAFLRQSIEQAEKQEPVALKMVHGEVCCQSKHDDQSFGMWCPITEDEFPNGTPFYTAAPRKPWVGLTDEDVDWILGLAYADDMELIKTIEAKLKELNA